MKNFLLLILFFYLASCKWFTGSGTPFFKWSDFKVPPGTPTFQQGFKDGCSTVLYARGNVWYRTRYGYRYDPKMIGNPEYRFGHSRGYTWCFQQVLAGTSGPVGSFDKYLNPGGYDSTFNSKNINEAWDGMFVAGGDGGGIWGTSVTTPGSGFNAIFDVMQKSESGGGSGGVFNSNPFYAGGSVGQFFGQGFSGSYYGQ